MKLKTLNQILGVLVTEGRTDLAEELNEQKKSPLRKNVLEYFKNKDADLSDDAIHNYAESLGTDEHKFEEEIYKVLHDFLGAGKYVNSKEKIVPDPKELEMGIKVEMEHTVCPEISRRIALDHLTEIPDYYTRLAKMEKEEGVEH